MKFDDDQKLIAAKKEIRELQKKDIAWFNEALRKQIEINDRGARIEELEKALIEERATNLTWASDSSKIGNNYEEPFYILAKEELQKEGLL